MSRVLMNGVAATALLLAFGTGCAPLKPTTPATTPPPAAEPSRSPETTPGTTPQTSPATSTVRQPESPTPDTAEVRSKQAAPAQSPRTATERSPPKATASKATDQPPARASTPSTKTNEKSAADKSAAPAASIAATAPTAPALDLRSLEQRLKDTRAIGVMTKLSLKNQVDDLLDEFRAFYAGKIKTPLPELRQRYDLLLMKVLSLLQDSDSALASAISSSRESIWGILRDPKKFAEFDA